MSVRTAVQYTRRKLLHPSQLLRPIGVLRIDCFSLQPLSTVVGKKRWMTSASEDKKPELLYEGPMAPLITSLKVFSLSSTFLSVFGLPALMYWRDIDWTSVHVLMVATTMAGSIASTCGLQYIFAPYVYRLETIPIRQCDHVHKRKEMTGPSDDDDLAPEGEESTKVSVQSTLLKATTRSILATKVEHVFDPEVDVKGVPGGTMRPFCSFFAKGKPLYIHEQMISDPALSRHLFVNHGTVIAKEKNPDPDDDFL